MSGGRTFSIAGSPTWAAVAAAVLTAGIATPSPAGWADARIAGPFICRADFSLAGLEGLLESLSTLQNDLIQSLDIAAAKEPIEIYLFHDQATYNGYMKKYLPGLPNRRALYVKSQGPGRVFAYWSRDFEVDLRHECTHALLHAALPVVPLWLDEGLAQFFEVTAPRRNQGHPHLGSVRWNTRWGYVPKVQDLEAKADISQMGRSEYRDAWAWVHFMLLGPVPAREELKGFLADLHHSTPPGRLSERLAGRLPKLEAEFTEHFLQSPP